MKNIYFLFLLFSFSAANSQVEIGTSIFPEVGDTLRVTTVGNYETFGDSLVGGPHVWDLSNLPMNFVAEQVFKNVEESEDGDMFPEATMYTGSPTTQEVFYQTLDDKVLELGRSGIDPAIGLIDATFRFTGEAVFRQAPINLDDTFVEQNVVSIAVSKDILPDTLLNSLGPLVAFVDSFRLAVQSESLDTVDAFGTMILPSGEFEVLRVRKQIRINNEIEVKSFLGWAPLPDDLLEQLGPLGEQLGETNTTTYEFYANDVPEVLASVTELPDSEFGNRFSVTYKSDPGVLNVVTLPSDVPDALAYPNPTYGRINFELFNLPADEYTVTVYNIIGKKMRSFVIPLGKTKLATDLYGLRKGTYMYSVRNSKGAIVTTKRLMIMTP